MNKILLLLLSATLIAACNKPPTDKAHTREMFDAGGFQVITSFANSKQQTMSVLYGNAAARFYASTPGENQLPGTVFKLVTYKQADNKFWYGSHINGALQSVESITGLEDRLAYKLEYGQPPVDSFGQVISTSTRSNYILSRRPSVFP